MFRKKLLTFIRTLENDTYAIYDPLRVRLLNRLRLGFSHLREHKFRHNFADSLNPLRSCSLETEDAEHYFLHCQNNLSLRTTLMNHLNNINTAIASLIIVPFTSIQVVLNFDRKKKSSVKTCDHVSSPCGRLFYTVTSVSFTDSFDLK